MYQYAINTPLQVEAQCHELCLLKCSQDESFQELAENVRQLVIGVDIITHNFLLKHIFLTK